MENLKIKPLNQRPSLLSDQVSEPSQIQLEMYASRQFQKRKFSIIKQQIEGKNKDNQRRKQSMVLYFLNIGLLVTMSCMNADNILNSQALTQQKLIGTSVIAVSIGLVGFISSFTLAPWRQVLKLYVLLDNSVAVLIATLISFNALTNIFPNDSWLFTVSIICFPIWVISIGVNQRISIKYGQWTQWQILLYKMVLGSNAIVFFYIGYRLLNGAYKVTKGYMVQLQNRYRDLMILYTFGVVQLYYEYFRRVSYFDQTQELRYEYAFKDQHGEENQQIFDQELKKAELQQLKKNTFKLAHDKQKKEEIQQSESESESSEHSHKDS